ncbi:ATP-binding protein [Streptomyces sp. NPDC001594]|uniref:ATP-binding protein n=1 Tax=Streptomyces sp. NPDC001594 TaxID=3364590 RepID=UPI003686CAC4
MTTPHSTAPAVLRPARQDKAVRDARKLVSGVLDICRASGCETHLTRADDVLLVVSELVTNACRHAGGAGEVRVRWQRGELLVEVEDASDALPREPAQDAKGEGGGYGCELVTALADRWGVVPRRTPATAPTASTVPACSGKTVYACFALN